MSEPSEKAQSIFKANWSIQEFTVSSSFKWSAHSGNVDCRQHALLNNKLASWDMILVE